MENGKISEAELRREKRRQKILSGSNERMKKIIGGYSADAQDVDPTLVSGWSDEAVAETGNFISDRTEVLTTSSKSRPPQNEDHSSDTHGHVTPVPDDISTQEQPSLSLTPDNDTSPSQPTHSSFTTIRTLLVLFIGILIRVSFLSSFGQEYVQTLFNPFMTLEVIIIGYQKAVDMDLGANIKGGIWLSTLVLTGIKPEIITTYKTLMGIITAAATDFMLYFFGFMITHIIL